jgi:hypothetical protein
MRSDLLDLEVWVHHQTAAAALVSGIGANSEKVWLAFSMFEWSTEPAGLTGPAEISIPRRTAEEKGLA